VLSDDLKIRIYGDVCNQISTGRIRPDERQSEEEIPSLYGVGIRDLRLCWHSSSCKTITLGVQ
jgi:DNA-binding GntR family transcriptional regulator